MYKITVSGTAQVGKSSIINSYMTNTTCSDVTFIESNNSFEESDAVLFVFDLTSPSSLYKINQIYRNFKIIGSAKGGLQWLIGNKNDINRGIEIEKCTEFALSKQMTYKEISAKNSNDVLNTINSIIEKTKYLNPKKKHLTKSDQCISQ